MNNKLILLLLLSSVSTSWSMRVQTITQSCDDSSSAVLVEEPVQIDTGRFTQAKFYGRINMNQDSCKEDIVEKLDYKADTEKILPDFPKKKRKHSKSYVISVDDELTIRSTDKFVAAFKKSPRKHKFFFMISIPK